MRERDGLRMAELATTDACAASGVALIVAGESTECSV
jgi:hypothetical protein